MTPLNLIRADAVSKAIYLFVNGCTLSHSFIIFSFGTSNKQRTVFIYSTSFGVPFQADKELLQRHDSLVAQHEKLQAAHAAMNAKQEDLIKKYRVMHAKYKASVNDKKVWCVNLAPMCRNTTTCIIWHAIEYHPHSECSVVLVGALHCGFVLSEKH